MSGWPRLALIAVVAWPAVAAGDDRVCSRLSGLIGKKTVTFAEVCAALQSWAPRPLCGVAVEPAPAAVPTVAPAAGKGFSVAGALGAGAFVDGGGFSPSLLVGEVGVTYGLPEPEPRSGHVDRARERMRDVEAVVQGAIDSLRLRRVGLSVKADEELLEVLGSLKVVDELVVSVDVPGSPPAATVSPGVGGGEATTLAVLSALVTCLRNGRSAACTEVSDFAKCAGDPIDCARGVWPKRLNAPAPTATPGPTPSATPAPSARATGRNEATVRVSRSGEERLRLIREIGDLDCALAVLEAWSRQLEVAATPTPAPTARPATATTELVPTVTAFMGLEPLRVRCDGPCAEERVHRLQVGLRGECLKPLNYRAAVGVSMEVGYVSGDLGGLSGADRLSVEVLVSSVLGSPAEGLSGGFFGSAMVGWRWAPYLRFEDPKTGAQRLVGYAEVGHSDLGGQTIRPVLALWVDRALGTGPSRDRVALLARVRFR